MENDVVRLQQDRSMVTPITSQIYPLLPIGRLVQGHPNKQITKITFGPDRGQPLLNKDKTPRIDFFCAIAIEKTDPKWPGVNAQIQAEGAKVWPGGQSLLPGFKWKILDGDTPEHVKKEGFKGCWVVTCKSTSIMPMGYTQNAQNTGYDPILDPLETVKCGDYIRMSVRIAANGQTGDNIGIFMNGYKYFFVRAGEAIVSGPTAEEVFGAVTPPVTAATPAPVTSGTPAVVAATNTPPPDMSFVHPPVTPVPVATVTPPTTGGIVVTPKAGEGMTWERLKGVGWTEDVARKLGMIV